MEAIACKTPVICTKIRGNEDLVHSSKDMFNASLEETIGILKEKLVAKNKLIDRKTLEAKMVQSVKKNYKNLLKYSVIEVEKRMKEIYKRK